MKAKEISDPSVYFPFDKEKWVKELGKEALIENLKKMLLIRNFEIRAETGYLQGHIGGFFHSYMGQEAIQSSVLEVFGKNHWYITTYRCHALALLLGASPKEIMAEFFGKASGNALGRGGSMHLYTEQMLGGFGIVGGHIPIAAGAAFTIKYKKEKNKVAFCFLGDGAVAQGAFHEALNLASLWDLPLIIVIENNQWGMGTAVKRAISVDGIAEKKAPGYGIKSYCIDGMDFFNCVACFKHIKKEVIETSRPVIVEAVTERFRGHSISDPGLYRSKEHLKEIMEYGPIKRLKNELINRKYITEEQFKTFDKEQKKIGLDALKYAEESAWPNPATLEDDVFAPEIELNKE
jgi:pyruvate dehydrogenase E1 component alpha subunit